MVVVVLSVVVQGSLTGTVARLLRLSVSAFEPLPWALGVRLREEPDGARLFTVEPGSPADGQVLNQLRGLESVVAVR